MKRMLGTSNVARRTPAPVLKSQSARLTEALARHTTGSEESASPATEAENVPKPPKLVGKQTKRKTDSLPARDPLAWAKAAATIKGWKVQRRSWTC